MSKLDSIDRVRALSIDEKCRAIANWIEPSVAWSGKHAPVSIGGAWQRSPLVWDAQTDTVIRRIELTPADFYDSEAASALILDASPEPELWLESNPGESKLWGFTPDLSEVLGAVWHEDRKTAIADGAALYALGWKDPL